jgi:hypothetical protein
MGGTRPKKELKLWLESRERIDLILNEWDLKEYGVLINEK